MIVCNVFVPVANNKRSGKRIKLQVFFCIFFWASAPKVLVWARWQPQGHKKNTCTCIFTCTHAHICTRSHLHAHAQTQHIHTHAHTTHAYAHAHMHKYTLACTHTHAVADPWSSLLLLLLLMRLIYSSICLLTSAKLFRSHGAFHMFLCWAIPQALDSGQ